MLYRTLFKIGRFFLTLALKVENPNVKWALCKAIATAALIEGCKALDGLCLDDATLAAIGYAE